MKDKIIFLLLCFVLAGCTTTEQAATVGGLGGAAVGGIIGHQSGHGVAGAAIGGAAGTIGGTPPAAPSRTARNRARRLRLSIMRRGG